MFVYSRHERMTRREPAALRASLARLAIFIPAWHEAAVIRPMLRHMPCALGVREISGSSSAVYPNDP
jgi:hypothetical protein